MDYVKLGDFSRWDFEVPVIASYDVGDVFRVYGAARYLYSRTEPDAELVDLAGEASGRSGVELGIPTLVHSHFYGATAGIGGGYRWIHLNLELTGGYTYCRTSVFGRRRDLGGATFYPAVGVELRFN